MRLSKVESLSIVAIVGLLAAIVVSFGLTIYGLVLAFSASIILGMVVLLFEPLPLVIGVIAVLAGVNVPAKIQAWLQLPF